jgi:hypothetical protein
MEGIEKHVYLFGDGSEYYIPIFPVSARIVNIENKQNN